MSAAPKLACGEVWCVVYTHWLKTGDPMTRAEIAEVMGLKRIPRPRDPMQHNGLILERVERPRYSKSYPGFEVGFQLVDAFLPSRESLRERLRHVESDVIREALLREVAA